VALVKVYGRTTPSGEWVTFTKTELQFSVGAVEKNSLSGSNFIRLATDPVKKRVYFGFEIKAHKEAMRFYAQEGKSSRRMCSAAGLYSRFEFIRKVRDRKDRAERRFKLDPVDKKDKGVYPQFTYYIQL
jgi:hypothetical protein